jgi:hypothetical protein
MNRNLKSGLLGLVASLAIAAPTGYGIGYLFGTETVDVSPLVAPPASEPLPAVPQTLVDLKPGEKVGEEAYWGDFHLNLGWTVERWMDSTMFNFNAKVTNESGQLKVARVQAKFYAGHQIVGYALCRITLNPGETKTLICADSIARYTPHWNRMTVTSS